MYYKKFLKSFGGTKKKCHQFGKCRLRNPTRFTIKHLPGAIKWMIYIVLVALYIHAMLFC
ncbi:hypothetical protein BK751_15580 [Bacillus thuringiensis serovar galleriae]|nr:hypothetical protein BF15_12240 [Bacillus thuringiensis]OTW49622.1 hypothetical protein BK701_30050 [Bacillus thuringiensis serovar amagiensis]OTY77780.1 hypothetical protein BK747_01275 [Bacillus thuringiensis serovar azorensis]OTY88299.1 hypothetical protein BK751_15580 [Bacillus thuringiensis serovar galleriae]OTZ64767.1 hypothetical protein BK766_01165 [Bacillus thuringiensis serovar wuhanensis]